MYGLKNVKINNIKNYIDWNDKSTFNLSGNYSKIYSKIKI